MAKNQVFKFVDVLSVPVPEGTKSGDPVIVHAASGWVGVAETDRRETAEDWVVDSYDDPFAGGNAPGYASVSFKGAYDLTVTGALTVGQPVYIQSNGSLTATAGSNTRFGRSLTTKGAAAGLATVLIDPAPAAAVTP